MIAPFVSRLVLLALLLPSLAAADATPSAVQLPAPRQDGAVSLDAALSTRRSIRALSSEKALTLAQIGQLLWAAQGVTGPDGRRTTPSAKRQYPLEIAVVAQNVEGLPKGAWRYVPSRHALEPLAPASEGGPLFARATSQKQVHAAPAVFVIAAVYERMDAGARSQSWTDFEAGAATQNLLLAATALRLGSVVVGGIDAAVARDALRFPGREQVVVLVPVGHPAG